MAYTGVYVFGDSLVDAGNALELAETAGSLPFVALPDGAPTASLGYFDGRFSNGYTFADLISNKYVGVPTEPIYPFGYEEPLLGLSFPFVSEPDGNNLNWAYGGAQIVQGSEAVPDLDSQLDAYRDAVDGHADPQALHMFTIGGNDVRELVPATGSIAGEASAVAKLQAAAAELFEELDQLIGIGAQHLLVTGIPDVGIIPYYNGLPDEAARRAAATHYSDLLDGMIQQQIAQLQAAHPLLEIRYVSFDDAVADIVPNMQALYGTAAVYPLNQSELLFFDTVHPTAQAHALLAASILDSTNPAGPAGEVLPLLNPTMKLSGNIAVAGEVDGYTLSLIAGHSYMFDLRGVSSGGGTIGDPVLQITSLAGTVLASNDDGGLGLDTHLTFTAMTTGDYKIRLGAVGSLTGTYVLDILSSDGAGDNLHYVSDPSRMIIEGVGQGNDKVLASVSYVLNSGAAVEWLATTNDAGTAAFNLTGNEFGQTITGNAGNNILTGGGGADVLVGLGGNDTFILDSLSATIVEASGGGIDTVETTIGYTLGANLENLKLKGTAAIAATGNSLANSITGNDAANLLDGKAGADILAGGLGNDTYVVDNAGDQLVEASGGGTDLVQSSLSFTLPAFVENLTLTGTAAINATGNGLNNLLTGNSGNNVLNGGAGSDTMVGGLGNDTYVLDTGNDKIIEGSGGGIDTIQAGFSYTLGADLENLTLTGTSSINGTGNGLNNLILGNAAANTLNGGAGADTMDGGGGNDTYVVDAVGDVAAEANAAGGTDTVKASVSHVLGTNIENLTLTGAASINGTGNGLANTILGTEGVNLLAGLAGDDVIHGGKGADKLNGGLGMDMVKGGDGADTFIFDTPIGPGNVDTLIEYSVSDDTIWLSKAIFGAIAATGTLDAAAFRTGPAALDADDRIIYDKVNGNIYYDADGNGAGLAIQFAHVSPGLALANTDFFLTY